MLRARLSVCALEERENPSGPALIDPFIDPSTGSSPSGIEPPAPAQGTIALIAVVAIDAVDTAINPSSPAPLDDFNSIYKTPLIPYYEPSNP